MESILVAGGAGFIGSNFVRLLLARTEARVVVPRSAHVRGQSREPRRRPIAPPLHAFVQGDIADRAAGREPAPAAPAGRRREPGGRDPRRPLDRRSARVRRDQPSSAPSSSSTRRASTSQTLEPRARAPLPVPARLHRRGVRLARARRDASPRGAPYAPNSPYAASKAGADHLVRAYHETYRLPTLRHELLEQLRARTSIPEKLIPLMTLNAIEGRPLPLYGDGGNVRDWLHVEDHCAALLLRAAARACPAVGTTSGAGDERTNLEIVDGICAALEAIRPAAGQSRAGRAGRAALRRSADVRRRPPGPRSALRRSMRPGSRPELGWRPVHRFATGSSRHRAPGISSTAPGARPCSRGKYGRERLGLRTSGPRPR